MAKQRFRKSKKEKKPSEKSITKREDLASSGVKIKAFLTDSFMLVMPIMYIVIYMVLDGREGFQSNMLWGWVLILFPLVVVQTLFMHFTGQTPGYRAYDITLIDNHTQRTPTWGIILFRNLSAILSLFTLIGWALMFFRKDHKNLHDLLSATSVIYKK